MLYQVAENDEPMITTANEDTALSWYKSSCRMAKRGSVIYFLTKEDGDFSGG